MARPKQTEPTPEPDVADLFALSSELVGAIDRDGTFLVLSPAWGRGDRRPPVRLQELVFPDDRNRLTAFIRAAFSGGETTCHVHLAAGGEPVEIRLGARHDGSMYAAATPTSSAASTASAGSANARGARLDVERQNALFHAIFEDSSETVIVTDSDRRIRMVNPAFTRLFGYSSDEVVGQTTRILYASERDHARVGASYEDRSSNADTSARTHTIRFRARDGDEFFAETVTDLIHDSDGRHMGYVGLIRDVTQRLHAEAELQRQRKQYAGLVESTSAILWEADPADFRFTFISGEAENLLGYPVERWTTEPTFWVEHMHPDDRDWAPDYCKQATEAHERHSFDYRMIAADGRTVWLRDAVSVIVENGRPSKLVGAMIDITETKEAEQELAESERRYRDLYHRTPVMLHSIDGNGRITAVSGYWLQHLGYTEDDVLGRHSVEFLAPESRRRAEQEVLPELARTGVCDNIPYEVVRADGTVIDVLLSSVGDFDESGNFVGSLAVMTDVTEQRRAEANYQDIFENVTQGIYRISPDRRILHANPALVQLHGFSTEQQLIDACSDTSTAWFVDPADCDRINDILEREGRVDNFEAEIHRRGTGEKIWVSENSRAVRDRSGELIYYEGTISDITERITKERELANSEERYRMLYNRTPIMLHSIDADGRLIAVSEYWLEHLGYAEDQVLGYRSIDFLTDESRRHVVEHAMPAFWESGSCKDLPLQIVRSNGEILDVLLSAIVERDGQGNVVRGLGVMTDVTEQRRAEASYQDIFENVTQGIFRTSPDGRLLKANPALARMHGFESAEELLDSVTDLATQWYVDPQDRERITTALDAEGHVENFELEIYHQKTGDRIWISENARAVRDNTGELLYYEGTVSDITERILKARELERNEARFRQLYHNTPVMLHSADAEGHIVDVSDHWLSHLGYRRDEVIGHRFAEFLTGASRKRAEEIYIPQMFREGHVSDIEYRIRRKDGTIREVLLSARVVYDEQGEATGRHAVLTDITERRQMETEYRDIFENTSEGIYRSTPDGKLMRANPALARMQGFETPEELIEAVEDLAVDWYVDPTARERMKEILYREGYVDSFEAEITQLNGGGQKWTSETVHLTRDVNGEVCYFEGTVRDITAEYKARELAAHRNEVLQMIARNDPVTGTLYEIIGIAEQQFDRLTAAIFRLQDGKLYSAAAPGLSNACIRAVDGAAPADVGSAIEAALQSDSEAVDSHLAENEDTPVFVRAVRKSGYGAVMAVPIRDRQGTVLGVLAAFSRRVGDLDRETTDLLHEMAQIASIAIEQYRLSEALLHQAQYDTLTELPNRALLSDRLAQALRDAERGDYAVGVLLLDLDEFKLINDTLGHSAGDDLLQQVASRLHSCLRAGDTVARLGGDEFVLVVPLQAGSHHCTDIAER